MVCSRSGLTQDLEFTKTSIVHIPITNEVDSLETSSESNLNDCLANLKNNKDNE
jgi:hypothetical protein